MADTQAQIPVLLSPLMQPGTTADKSLKSNERLTDTSDTVPFADQLRQASEDAGRNPLPVDTVVDETSISMAVQSVAGQSGPEGKNEIGMTVGNPALAVSPGESVERKLVARATPGIQEQQPGLLAGEDKVAGKLELQKDDAGIVAQEGLVTVAGSVIGGSDTADVIATPDPVASAPEGVQRVLAVDSTRQRSAQPETVSTTQEGLPVSVAASTMVQVEVADNVAADPLPRTNPGMTESAPIVLALNNSRGIDAALHYKNDPGSAKLPFQVRTQSHEGARGTDNTAMVSRIDPLNIELPGIDPVTGSSGAVTSTTAMAIARAQSGMANNPPTKVTSSVAVQAGAVEGLSAAPIQVHSAATPLQPSVAAMPVNATALPVVTDTVIQSQFQPVVAEGPQLESVIPGPVYSGIPLEKVVITDAIELPEMPDNMFHVASTGTITAPQPLRVDTSASALVSAPHTVGLLAPDAEESLSSNVKWMVNDGVKNAVINVNPSGMGPIKVTLDIGKDHMNVSIVANQGTTREALDAMLPRLREQLGAQGFESVNVDISDGRSDSMRGNAQQQFGQARGELAGSGQSGMREQAGERTAEGDGYGLNESGRLMDDRADAVATDAAGVDSGSRNLYDAYV